MTTDSLAHTVTLYRVVAGVLAVGTALLGYALNQAVIERDQVQLQMRPGQTKEVVPHISIYDMHQIQKYLDHLEADKPDEDKWLYDSPAGGVVVRSLSFRQIMPPHLRRLTHEAVVPFFGDLEVAHYGASPESTSSDKPSPTTLWYTPPYTTHSYRNVSDSHVAMMLAFTTRSDDGDRHGSTYLLPGDDRLQLGGTPVRFDVKQDAEALAQSGQPFRLSWPALMDGKLASLAVATEAALDPLPYPSVAYVVTGKGQIYAGANAAKLRAAPPRPLEGGSLVILPKGTLLRLTAQASAPLGVLLFQPERDQVSDILSKGKALYSQNKEELIIRDFFQDQRDGVFLDVGAGHYQHLSTTYYLEERLGWSGVSVDALAEYAAGYQEHRKRTRFANYLITEKAQGKLKFYRSGNDQAVSSMSQREAAEGPGGGNVTEVEVPTISATELLDQLGVKKIDLLSMDIEDHEPAGLAGFDIDRFQPRLVCIEAHRVGQDAIFAYFKKHGYGRLDKYLAYDSTNWYFAPAAPPAR